MSTAIATREPIPGNRALIKRVVDFARDKHFAPGDRLPAERVLAEKLGVSRNALREALATLESLRVVEARPNSGVFLRRSAAESSFEATVLLAEQGIEPTATEVRESIEVRTLLERQAITLACAHRTEADLSALKAVLGDTRALLAVGGNIADCDQTFHRALADASHNSVLARMLNAFYCLTLPRRRSYFADPSRGAASDRAHRRIVTAIEKRDVALASSLMARHLGNAQVYWKEALQAGSSDALKA